MSLSIAETIRDSFLTGIGEGTVLSCHAATAFDYIVNGNIGKVKEIDSYAKCIEFQDGSVLRVFKYDYNDTVTIYAQDKRC